MSIEARWNSLRTKLVMGLMIIIIPLLGMLAYIQLQAVSNVRSQTISSYKDILDIQIGIVNGELRNVDRDLKRLAANDNDLRMLPYTKDRDGYMMRKLAVSKNLFDTAQNYQIIYGFFVYEKGRGDLFLQYNENGEWKAREGIKASLSQLLEQERTVPLRWSLMKMEENPYAICLLDMGDLYVGAIAPLSNFISLPSAKELDSPDNIAVYYDNRIVETNHEYASILDVIIEPYVDDYIKVEETTYLVSAKPLNAKSFGLAIGAIKSKLTPGGFTSDWRITGVIPIVVILILLSVYVINAACLSPLKSILKATVEIKRGNLEARIPPFKAANEYQSVVQSFNSMVEEVANLKINVYEEQLNRQRAVLENMKQQINPHFYMNTLNMIYSLATIKNYQLIQQVSQHLSSYFHYAFNNSSSLVPLQDELGHVKNYMRIQEMRFPNRFYFKLLVEEDCDHALVPPLIIHTFIENAIKYAQKDDHKLEVQIDISRLFINDEYYIHIVIQDNGDGFSPKILGILNNGLKLKDERGEHTGIWNVHNRVGILYRQQAHISFNNRMDHSGAQVEIKLPLFTEYKEVYTQ